MISNSYAARREAWSHVMDGTRAALDTPGLTAEDRTSLLAIYIGAAEISERPIAAVPCVLAEVIPIRQDDAR